MISKKEISSDDILKDSIEDVFTTLYRTLDKLEGIVVTKQLGRNQEKQETLRKNGFQKTEKFGYVNSSPLNLGAAMRLAIQVDLPGWTLKGLKDLTERCNELKLRLHVDNVSPQHNGNFLMYF